MSRGFGRLRLRLLLAFVAVALVPLGVMAGWSLRQSLAVVENLTRDSLRDQAALTAVEVEKALNAGKSDLFFLSQLGSLRRILAVAEPADPAAGAALAGDLARVIAPDPAYAGAVFVDAAGAEVARVVRAKEQVQILPAGRLRPAGADRSMERSLALPPGALEVGTLETQDPLRPGLGAVVRLGAAVRDDHGERCGALAVDLRLQAVLGEVRQRGVGAERLLVIDGRGAYVEDPPSRSGPLEPPWRDDLASRYPGVLAHLGRPEPALLETGAGTMIALHPVEAGGAAPAWLVASVRAGSGMTGPLRQAYVALATVALLALGLAVLLGRMVAGWFTRPLQRLAGDLESARRRLEESEAELIQSEKLAGLGRLAASVAHEINNPVAIISMYAQMLREGQAQPELREPVERILDSAQAVSRTVKDLLDSARRMPPLSEPVALDRVLEVALEQVRAVGLPPEVALEIDGDPQAVVAGDPGQLAQVLRNLLENAVQAARSRPAAGGRGRVRVAIRRDGGEVEVAVADDGPGISPEAMPRLFEPFFTTKHGAGQGGGRGTGLGLFVAWGIVKSHRGRIRAENLPGGGAQVVVRLPAAEGGAPGAPPPELT